MPDASPHLRELVPITAPEMGAGPHPISVVLWLVDAGSPVAAADRLLEVLAAGVLFHVAAPCSGTLVQQTVSGGEVVQPGQPLGWVLPGDMSAPES